MLPAVEEALLHPEPQAPSPKPIDDDRSKREELSRPSMELACVSKQTCELHPMKKRPRPPAARAKLLPVVPSVAEIISARPTPTAGQGQRQVNGKSAAGGENKRTSVSSAGTKYGGGNTSESNLAVVSLHY